MIVLPVCPACGGLWRVTIPDGRWKVRIPCRRCGVETEYRVDDIQDVEAAVVAMLAKQIERDQDRARSICLARFAIVSAALGIVACTVAVILTGSAVPLLGVPLNALAIVAGRSVVALLRRR